MVQPPGPAPESLPGPEAVRCHWDLLSGKMLCKHLALLSFKWDFFYYCDEVWAQPEQAPCLCGCVALGC